MAQNEEKDFKLNFKPEEELPCKAGLRQDFSISGLNTTIRGIAMSQTGRFLCVISDGTEPKRTVAILEYNDKEGRYSPVLKRCVTRVWNFSPCFFTKNVTSNNSGESSFLILQSDTDSGNLVMLSVPDFEQKFTLSSSSPSSTLQCAASTDDLTFVAGGAKGSGTTFFWMRNNSSSEKEPTYSFLDKCTQKPDIQDANSVSFIPQNNNSNNNSTEVSATLVSAHYGGEVLAHLVKAQRGKCESASVTKLWTYENATSTTMFAASPTRDFIACVGSLALGGSFFVLLDHSGTLIREIKPGSESENSPGVARRACAFDGTGLVIVLTDDHVVRFFDVKRPKGKEEFYVDGNKTALKLGNDGSHWGLAAVYSRGTVFVSASHEPMSENVVASIKCDFLRKFFFKRDVFLIQLRGNKSKNRIVKLLNDEYVPMRLVYRFCG